MSTPLRKVFPGTTFTNVCDRLRENSESLSEHVDWSGAISDQSHSVFGQLGRVDPFSVPSAVLPIVRLSGIIRVFFLCAYEQVSRINALAVCAEVPCDLSDLRRSAAGQHDRDDMHTEPPTSVHNLTVARFAVVIGLLYTCVDLVFNASLYGRAQPRKRLALLGTACKRITVFVLSPVVAMAQIGLVQRTLAPRDAAREQLAPRLSGLVVVRTAQTFSQHRPVAAARGANVVHAGSASLGGLKGVYHSNLCSTD